MRGTVEPRTLSDRPLCSEASLERNEPLTATASRVEHWLLVEYGGYWPYEPLDAAVFPGAVRDHLAAQLGALPHARLLLVKRPGRGREERVRVFFGRTPERGRTFRRLELDRHQDLVDLDLAALLDDAVAVGEPLDHPLLLVCTHGIRDRCCARYGHALCAALHAVADPEWVWQSSHVGGDRFAGNVVCLPEGLYFGRVPRRAVRPLLDRYLVGQIALDHYRGRSCYSFAVQAAERRVRIETGLTGFHDIRVVRQRRTAADAWKVDFLAEVAGDVYSVDVRVALADPAYLTCRALEPRPARHFVAQSHRVIEAVAPRRRA